MEVLDPDPFRIDLRNDLAFQLDPGSKYRLGQCPFNLENSSEPGEEKVYHASARRKIPLDVHAVDRVKGGERMGNVEDKIILTSITLVIAKQARGNIYRC